jgi:hypothetical protein
MMKPNLDSVSKRLCNLACAAFIAPWIFPAATGWLTGFALVAATAGLALMLAHEVSARKRSERAAQPAVVTH